MHMIKLNIDDKSNKNQTVWIFPREMYNSYLHITVLYD